MSTNHHWDRVPREVILLVIAAITIVVVVAMLTGHLEVLAALVTGAIGHVLGYRHGAGKSA